MMHHTVRGDQTQNPLRMVKQASVGTVAVVAFIMAMQTSRDESDDSVNLVSALWR